MRNLCLLNFPQREFAVAFVTELLVRCCGTCHVKHFSSVLRRNCAFRAVITRTGVVARGLNKHDRSDGIDSYGSVGDLEPIGYPFHHRRNFHVFSSRHGNSIAYHTERRLCEIAIVSLGFVQPPPISFCV